MELIYVAGHQSIESNEKAVKCAEIGLYLDENITCKAVQTSLVAVTSKIDDWALKDIPNRWTSINTCRI